MPYLGNEETLVEEPAIAYLTDKLGYEFIHGEKLLPDQGEREFMSDVILVKRLRDSLKRINPWMDDSNITKAVAHITVADNLGANLLEINEKLHDAMVNLNYALDQDLDGSGHKKFHTVKYIDWDDVDNNEFLVTRQFKVHGPVEKIIPDIVIFINGIPIVRNTLGPVVGLPEPEEGVTLVVPFMICQACPDRKDLYAPDTTPASVVRDENGRIVGVRRLQKA